MLELLLFRAVSVGLLILGNGFFVAAEFAIVSIRATRIEQLLAQNRPGAGAVDRLRRNLNDFLPAVQLGVTLASLALGWLGEPLVANLLEDVFHDIPHVRWIAHGIAVPLAFVFITYFHVLLGELVPKALALNRSEHMALAVAGPMEFFIQVTRPAVHLMNRSALLVLRAFKTKSMVEAGAHSPEELKLIATATRRAGLFGEVEENILHRALDLPDVQVREIMTPRQSIFSLPADMLIEDASARIVEEQHSRIPVYEPASGPENIIGVVYSKEVSRLIHFRLTAQTRFGRTPFGELRLRQLMRDVLVVPETKEVLDLLGEFQAKRRHLAIVVDEFGSTTGLVSVEDALEQLVGELEDEFDVGVRPTLSNATGPIILDGSVTIRDLESQMGVSLPRDGDVETLAGFLLASLGKIPSGGETVRYGGRRFTVSEMDRHRISKVRIQLEKELQKKENAPVQSNSEAHRSELSEGPGLNKKDQDAMTAKDSIRTGQ